MRTATSLIAGVLALALAVVVTVAGVLGGGASAAGSELAGCTPGAILPGGPSQGMPPAGTRGESVALVVIDTGFPPQEWINATAVALAESEGNPAATNTNTDAARSTDYGLFQINGFWHRDRLAGIDWADPYQNAAVAYDIWADSGGWTLWATWTNGRAETFRAEATDGVAAAVGLGPAPPIIGEDPPAAPQPAAAPGPGFGCTPPVGVGACPPAPGNHAGTERGLSPDALLVLRCVLEAFGWIEVTGGVAGRPIEGSDHPTGRAVDFMIPDYATPAGNAAGWDVATWVMGNAEALGVTYVIYDGSIWNADFDEPGRWRPYCHQLDPRCVSDVLSHRDHVHVSVAGNQAGMIR